MAFSRIGLASLLIACSACVPAQWSVQIYQVPGFVKTSASGTDGSNVVGNAYTTNQEADDFPRARLWRSHTDSVDLTPANADYAWASGPVGNQIPGYAFFAGHSHGGFWSLGQNPVWTDLHPSGATNSMCTSTDGSTQAGSYAPGASLDRACLWQGSAASLQDLHPSGFSSSRITALAAGEQVGYSSALVNGPRSAGRWSGTAGSWVNLNPAGYGESIAVATDGLHQFGSVYANQGDSPTAAMWTGTAASFVSLHPSGASISSVNAAIPGYEAGAVDGHAGIWTGTAGSFNDLFAFLPNGYVAANAYSVSSIGGRIYVCGIAYLPYPNGYDAVVWSAPVPEPCSLLVLGFAVLGFRFRSRSRRNGE